MLDDGLLTPNDVLRRRMHYQKMQSQKNSYTKLALQCPPNDMANSWYNRVQLQR